MPHQVQGEASSTLKLPQKPDMRRCEVTVVLSNLMVVITLQYIHVSNHVTLNLHNVTCQSYLNKAGKTNTKAFLLLEKYITFKCMKLVFLIHHLSL